MGETSEVAIIGGGAAGCAVAYYLAKAGVKATIIEREGVGRQASGYSAGGLNPLLGAGIPGPLGALAIESFRLHQELGEELNSESGEDYHLRVVSTVRVAFAESELPELEENLDIFEAAEGFSARWVESTELYEMEPRTAPGALRGLYTYGNAALDSYLYTVALSRAAERLGATVRLGEARDVSSSGGRVTAVRLENDEIACDAVVLAAGPWSGQAEHWLGAPIPVEPLKGEILRMTLPGPALLHDFSGAGGSVTPKPDGLVWLGGTEEWSGFDRQPSESARSSIQQGAIRLMPTMVDATLVKQTACLRPVTPDWLPIIGKAPGWENVYVATGGAMKGILVSPGMGRAVADLITQGTTELSIGSFGLERFVDALT